MIRRLKIKIIAIVLGTLLIVFAAILLVLNLSVYRTSAYRVGTFMDTVVENDGFLFPPRGKPDLRHEGGIDQFRTPEMMRAGRFFYVKTDHNGKIIEMNLEMMFDFSNDDALNYILAAADSGRREGNIDSFRFLSAEKPYGRITVFAERSIEISLLEQLTGTSLWVAGAVSFILACLAVFLANWMVTPVKTAFDKQQRFISDASHELKTPLTIISANVDVLQNEIGDNQRLTHIKDQSDRMNSLVHSLLTLAKTDEDQPHLVFSKFNLSGAVLKTALEFESFAFEEDKLYSYNIDENISFIGDEQQIKQLTSILIDNAIQYSDTGGQINVSLRSEGGRPHMSVFNTGIGVPNEEYEKIFERFYRHDESRSRETGGYGIGLSIAEAIVKSHKGKISVSGEYGKWVCFNVIL